MAHTSLRLKILALCTLVVLGGCEIPLLSSGLVAAAGLASVLQKKEKKEARILLSPTGVTYGDQVIVLTSTPKIITVSNTGNANLVVNNAFVSGADASSFVISNECLVAVSPGTSCRVNVSFAPKTVGAKAGTLVLNSNAANTAEPVLLTGNGFLPPPPQVTPASLTLNVLGITETRAEIQVTAIDQYQLPLTYSVTTQGTAGTAQFSAAQNSAGKLSYVVPGHAPGNSNVVDNIVIQVSNSYTNANVTIPITLRSDPLLRNQWHLRNTGQDAFSSTPPTPNVDMKIAGAWSLGVSGNGVKVAVIDDGVEAAHEDLQSNFQLDRSLNFVTKGQDPTPSSKDSHGTKVAGIIASTAFNGRGGRGVAYNAKIRGFNLLAPAASSQPNFVTAFGGADISSDNDIFNASLSSSYFNIVGLAVLPSWDPLRGEVLTNALTLRSSRGGVIVQSAGNEFGSLSKGDCVLANAFGVSCGNTASDPMRASTNIIVVAASNAEGKKSSYSTTGSGVWISAPGGEYGLSKTFVNASEVQFKPAIITTARTGCDKSAFSLAVNALDALGGNPLAASCQYTATMNGTSSAAPNISGVIALMIEANPLLTFRDIKYLLATTAVRLDPTFQGVSRDDLIPSAKVSLDLGWVQNAAGFWFSNWYGFGGVDAAAAVAAAKSYKNFLPAQKTATQHEFSPSGEIKIPSQSSYTYEIKVANNMTVNEGVLLYVNLETSVVGCNQVEMRSPSGTRSVLLQGLSGFKNAALANTRFVSNAFYGEPVSGQWRITYLNVCNSGSSTIKAGATQSLIMVGR